MSSLPFDSHKHSHNWLFTTLLFSLACRMIHWMQLYHTASFISGVKNRNFIFFGYTSLSRPFPTLSTLIKKPFEVTTTSEICVGTITAFIDVIGLSIITSRFFDVRTNYSSFFFSSFLPGECVLRTDAHAPQYSHSDIALLLPARAQWLPLTRSSDDSPSRFKRSWTRYVSSILYRKFTNSFSKGLSRITGRGSYGGTNGGIWDERVVKSIPLK